MSRTRQHPRRSHRQRRRGRRGGSLVVAVVSLAVGAGVLAFAVPRQLGDAEPLPSDPPPVAAAGRVDPTTPPPAAASPKAPPVYQLAVRPPSKGDYTFRYGNTTGKVAGRSGTLRRYRIAVENGSNEDIEAFGDQVDAALSDPRSWPAGGTIRLQRVAAGEPYSFTIYLATAETSHDMCARGGTNTNLEGEPYTSCRTVGKVIVNLDRWNLSVDHFVKAKIPLSLYRDYVVNHETGHELGNAHVRCPGKGRPAPVMMQQTLLLDGCKANPWPYVDGKLNTGPAL